MMQRAGARLSTQTYDLAVIGGGIYGAWVAWDAALRGLKVVLVEQNDFASATSANSQKIIHGGLRYLQHADIGRMRESIRERSALLRVAPHLVHPLPCLIPTSENLVHSRLAMRVALKLNDLISFDRNRGLEIGQSIPNGRMLSKEEVLQRCPGLNAKRLTGGALFYDAQVHNSERLILSILHAAAEAGADLANYTRVTELIQEEGAIRGVTVIDDLNGEKRQIRARMIVNCSGPWIHKLLGLHSQLQPIAPTRLFKATILVTRPIVEAVAVGLSAEDGYTDDDALIDKGYRFFFVTPWRDTSLVGTFYDAFNGDPASVSLTEEDIRQALAVINAAYPLAKLNRADVRFGYVGLLPRGDDGETAANIQYVKHYKIYDHAQIDGIDGLISIVGVKYTTARGVAEKAVDLALRKLGRQPIRCRTASTPVFGGDIDHLDEFCARAVEADPHGLSEETIRHLVATYGETYGEILRLLDENLLWRESVSANSPTIKAEIVYGVRAEMAQTLTDVILRRTALGASGYPGADCLHSCAAVMAAILGWDEKRIAHEIQETQSIYRLYEPSLRSAEVSTSQADRREAAEIVT
ncbi:MAG: glycerol-3-phosphate dehydrogenase/oxidase [Caldilineaceae bacterium]|nr:glycerol-3-phosphate dehydrogenase/oxidase [Caldilineaceae bacterium]